MSPQKYLLNFRLKTAMNKLEGGNMSIADIAYRVAEVLKLDRSLILPVTTEEMQEATPRPRFSGLSIAKAKREINYTPHTLEEGIKEMFT